MVRAARPARVTQWAPPPRSATSTPASASARRVSAGESATSARRTTGETPGLSVTLATATRRAHSRTSATMPQENASVWKVTLNYTLISRNNLCKYLLIRFRFQSVIVKKCSNNFLEKSLHESFSGGGSQASTYVQHAVLVLTLNTRF